MSLQTDSQNHFKTNADIQPIVYWKSSLTSLALHYQEWSDTYADVCSKWQDSSVNQAINQLVNTQFKGFLIGVTGGLVSGKAYFLNELLNHDIYSEQNEDNDLPILGESANELPILNQTITDIPALTEIAQKHIVTNKDAELHYNFTAESVNNNIIPLVLTYNNQLPNGFYFLKNSTFQDNVTIAEFLDLALQAQDVNVFDKNQWQTQAFSTQKELNKLSEYINIYEAVSEKTANSFGFDTDVLPSQTSDENKPLKLIPKWRMVIVNLQHHLLNNGASILDLPTTNGIFYHQQDTQKLMQLIHVNFHVMNCSASLTKEDAKILRKNDIFNANYLPNIILINNKAQYNFEPLLHNSWQVNPEHIYNYDTDITNNMIEFVVKHQRKLNHHIVEPLLDQVMEQSTYLTDQIKELDKDLLIKAKELEAIKRVNTQVNDSLAEINNKIKAIENVFSHSDASTLYQYIMNLLKEDRFLKFEGRARSLIKPEITNPEDIATTLYNARNVMLSGLKLEIKRCTAYIEQINNSMQSLYKDLNNPQEFQKCQPSQLTSQMELQEEHNIQITGSISQLFESDIINPLKKAYINDINEISRWYSYNMNVLRQPLNVLLSDKSMIQKNVDETQKKLEDASISITAVHTKSKFTQAAAQKLLGHLKLLKELT